MTIVCDQPSSFTNVTVTRQLAEINQVTDYVFSFKTTNTVPNSGYFILKIPKESVILNSGFLIKVDENNYSYTLIENGTDFYTVKIIEWCSGSCAEGR